MPTGGGVCGLQVECESLAAFRAHQLQEVHLSPADRVEDLGRGGEGRGGEGRGGGGGGGKEDNHSSLKAFIRGRGSWLYLVASDL